MPDIFLSYNREDQATARRFAEALQAEGLEVWWDATLRSGEAYDEVTEEALKTAKAVVVLWSPRSVASRWVRAEATLADRHKTLLPAMIEPCERPIMFELTQTADLSGWDGSSTDKAWQAFLGDVKRFVQAEASTAPADHRAPSPLGAPMSAPAEEVSIAVLPFVNMSADPEQEYFSDGLSEELINQLVKIKSLRVAGRTSCFAFKGKTDDLRLIGGKLGVNHVLEGSVRKAGQRLRITAQLIKCRDGFHLWSETYDRQLDDVFAIQDDVAREVAKELGVTLGVGEAMRAPGGPSGEAYDLYLRARALHASMAPADVGRSIEVYRKALALDPNFAQAWAGLSAAIAHSIIYRPDMIPTLRVEMEAAILRAAELAPDLQEINVGRAYLAWANYDWARAEACLAAWDGRTPDPLGIFSYFLALLGRSGEAVNLQLAARRSDPLSQGVSFGLQLAFDADGRSDEAEAEYERCRDLPGDHSVAGWRAVTRLMTGEDDERLRSRFETYVVDGLSWTPFDRRLLGVLDDRKAALAVVREAFDDPFCQDGPRMGAIASWAEYLGDRDLAFRALQRGFVELHGLTLIEIWHPVFARLRTDPRFKDILRGVGLADHWRRTGKWGDHARPVGEADFEIYR